jgi:adenine-specific DNA-methyltransferase
LDANRKLEEERRVELGQFLTPAPVARFMASMFEDVGGRTLRVLEAGAGVGSLIAAFVSEMATRRRKPTHLAVTAYEVDPHLASYLAETLIGCEAVCRRSGIEFSSELRRRDFIQDAAKQLSGGLFEPLPERFDCAILNPPYRKIHSKSAERNHLSSVGIETSNLYTGFLSLVMRLLDSGSELVAITPRSFCNGPYFRTFRRDFLEAMALRRIHVYDARNRAFRDDSVLQENVIVHAVKNHDRTTVEISSSGGGSDDVITTRQAPYEEVVDLADRNRFIYVVPDALGAAISTQMRRLPATLTELRIGVSTGRVVDFRARSWLRLEPEPGTVPLIYPNHLRGGEVTWPKNGKKPNALVDSEATAGLLLPGGVYTLVKRFSSKEERRRIVATVYRPAPGRDGPVAFENHLNVYHCDDEGLPVELAIGLAVFLNSSLVDLYFRQFSGHTQVNATDLRTLRYPSADSLRRLGRKAGEGPLDQDQVDQLIHEELSDMGEPDPVKAMKKIADATVILKALGLPRGQLNERSALTLLALLDLRPSTPWAKASSPLRGVSEMMSFFNEHYGKKYAPNTRETVRRQTIHQFEEAGLILRNPDDPERAVNSPKTVYKVTPQALEAIRTFSTKRWELALRSYLQIAQSLAEQWAYKREMARIPVKLGDVEISLSPGGQNDLIRRIIEEFCPRFTPGGHVLYVGDADSKWALNKEAEFADLGLAFDEHGKMPDVVIYYPEQEWLVLVEAVTSHGPMDPKRHMELKRLFKASKAGLVFVTAFEDRRTLNKFLRDIAWETEVWIAESPGHLIHFDGERFLGPYGPKEP